MRKHPAVILCPNCGAKTAVVDLCGEDGKEVIRRRRSCPKCKYRFDTFEKAEPFKETLKKL